jgi:protease IV
MFPQPPSGQGPLDPHGAFSPPPPPGGLPPSSPGMPSHMMSQQPHFPPAGYMPMPMPFFPHMMQPPKEKSFAKAIFMTLATSIFGLSILANVYLIAFSGLTANTTGLTTSTIETGNPKQKIAVIPIRGIIMDGQVGLVRQYIKFIEADPDVRAIVIEIDTPGGSATASDEIHHLLSGLKASKPNVPFVVTMGGMATSGGYYIACMADHIYAQPTTLTGNIGVRMDRLNVSELAKKWGIEDSTIAAPADGLKTAGSSWKPESEKERQYMQGLLNTTFTTFTERVESGRKGKLTRPRTEIFNGAAFTAQQAKTLGLVDSIGYREEAYAQAAALAGITGPTIYRVEYRASLVEMLVGIGAKNGAGGGGVHVNIDAAALEELSRPRVMAIYRGD